MLRPFTNFMTALRRMTGASSGVSDDQLIGSLATAQAELATSQQRLALALEATGDGIWDFRRGERTYFSDTYYKMLGYPADGNELQPDEWQKLVHPDDKPGLDEQTKRIQSGETDLLDVELRIRTSGGVWKWIVLRGRVITRMPQGLPLRMIGAAQDIDARHLVDQANRENQELFRNAFEGSPIGMALVKTDGRLMRVNTRFAEITGYTEAELLGLTFQDITHADDIDADVASVQEVLAGTRQSYEMEKRYVRKDGATVWVQLNAGVVFDAAQRPLYLIGQVQDITQRKLDQHELTAYAQRLLEANNELEKTTAELVAKTAEAEAAKAVAEEASRAKSAFLANISHEIRTPLAAIIGFANLLRDNRVPVAERAHCIETIARQGQHLLSLVNDILDISKIEAGKMMLESIECDPQQIVADVEAVTAARAFDKGLPLEIHIAPGTPRRVRTDPTRLRQVLLNLVSNAIKFTETGRITVNLSPVRLSGGGAGLKFVVRDTGIGMSRQQLGRLFQPFSQADASTTRRFGGTGLGLAISKRLVEMLRGTLAVRSEVGVGSTFEVNVIAPVCDATAPLQDRPGPGLRDGLRVLLAEDGPDNQRLIRFYLGHAGVACEVADNGRLAVEAAVAAAAAGRPFDLVLMDMQMPELDGCAATAALRQAGLTMPVLALTAHGTEDAQDQSLRAGCCEHLVKPVEYDALLAAIATHTQPRTHAVLTPDPGTLSQRPQFVSLLSQYVAELPGQVSELVRLCAAGRSEPLRRLLHQIKGAGGGYGFAGLSVAAARAEAAFVADDVDSLVRNVDELIRLMRSVQGYDRQGEVDHAATGTDH